MATIEKTDATVIEMGLNTRELIACSPLASGDQRTCVDRRWFYVVTVKDRRPLPLMDERLDRLGTLGGNRAGGVDRREPYLLHLVLIMNFYVFEHLMNNVPGPLRGTVVFPYVDDMIIPLTTVKYSSRVCNGYDQFQRYYHSGYQEEPNAEGAKKVRVRQKETRGSQLPSGPSCVDVDYEQGSHRVEYEVKDLREKGLNQNTVVAADKTKGWDNSANSRAELPGANTARRKWGAELRGADTARRKWRAELPGADTARRKCLLSKLLYEAMC
ncbi:hypothetical protein GEV33_015032 [Tenebrio molitor]|uniref:Uncharacterized protein n=1 Tax=Tenebrio molitor TaxID=7067 RepID=A0A8J6L0X4_TENMO|nr:hypothetical protein GEV33_015033 [Tenebrio molitor]KAH0807759.1 hypothetical protein GEV33_015032 [Tenebrio molitor]